MAGNDLGKKIQTLRKQAGMTQRDLAEKLVTAGSTISNWETGRRLPSIVDLARIADAFGVSISAFGLQTSKADDLGIMTEGIENIQVIVYKPYLKELSVSFLVAMLSSAMFLYASIIAPDSIIGAFLFMSGLLGMIIAFTLSIFKLMGGRQKHYVTRLVPLTSEVGYKTKMDQRLVETYHKRLKIFALIGFAVSMMTYGLFIHLSTLMRRPVVALIGGFVVVIALGVHIMRMNLLRKDSLFKIFIPYHRANKNLISYLLMFALSSDMVIYVAMMFQLVVAKLETIQPVLALFVGLSGLVSLAISVILFFVYHRYAASYDLIVTDYH